MTDISELASTIFEKYPCRFRAAEKDAFISFVNRELHEMGYSDSDIHITQTKRMMSTRNIVIGDAEKARTFITAHYDTPGRNGFLLESSKHVGQTGANFVFILMLIPLLVIMTVIERELEYAFGSLLGNMDSPLIYMLGAMLPVMLYFAFLILIMVVKNPSNRNDNTSGTLAALYCADRLADKVKSGDVCVVLFDNEEWGLIGSAHLSSELRKKKIDMKTRTVVNIDCVGVGSELVAAATRRIAGGSAAFIDAMDEGEDKKIIRKRSVMVYMSDHANFPDSFMLSAMDRSKLGPLFIPNIHTSKDTECDMELVESIAARVAAVAEKQQ